MEHTKAAETLPQPQVQCLSFPVPDASGSMGADEGGMFAQWDSTASDGCDQDTCAMLEDALSLLPDLEGLSKNKLGGGMSSAGVALMHEAGASALPLRG